MMTTPHVPEDTPTRGYLRPVNLQTDLAPLADLIELTFAAAMDESGRAAIREMRTMSHFGAALNWLGRLNDLALGISMGYVWLEDERLVGNVSIYPANYPPGAGVTWIVANVAVHPAYQRRGIATRLMQAALRTLRERGAQRAILQVDYDNLSAIDLYLKLGFRKERPFSTWERHSTTPPPSARSDLDSLFITRRRPSEWRQEYQLVQSSRQADQGGIGWLKPLHESFFHQPLWRQITGLLTMNTLERLIIRADDGVQLRAALWVENTLVALRTRLTLFANPHDTPDAAEALLRHALRRFRTTTCTIEHPYDDAPIIALLQQYHFRSERIVWHMRLDFA